MPRISGVHMADKDNPLNFSGGNVIGTRRMVLKMPCLPSICQNGLLLRRSFIVDFPLCVSILDEERTGMIVRRSLFKKSNILCLPGLTPVENVDHATGEIGGQVDLRSLNEPVSASFVKWGS